MRLEVTKQELQARLGNIQNIVEKRSTMPILSHFLLDATGPSAFIYATDLELAIKEPIEVKSERAGRIAIPARKLYDIVREVDGDITLDSEDGKWLKAKCGKSSFRLACLSADEFPSWPPMESFEEFRIDAVVLGSMIEKTIFSAGEADTRYTLNGLLFHLLPKDKTLTVVGTDGHRMALMKTGLSQSFTEEKKVIVPRKAASEVRKFLPAEGEISVLVGKNHILFKSGNVEFLARLIEGAYPNYAQVIPAESPKKLAIEKDTFVKSLRRVSIMSREQSNAVKCDFSEGKITLTSSNPDLGDATDEIAAEYSGETISIGFNARYLQDALNSVGTGKAVVEFNDQLSPTVIKEEGSEDYICIVMPMRI